MHTQGPILHARHTELKLSSSAGFLRNGIHFPSRLSRIQLIFEEITGRWPHRTMAVQFPQAPVPAPSPADTPDAHTHSPAREKPRALPLRPLGLLLPRPLPASAHAHSTRNLPNKLGSLFKETFMPALKRTK